MLCYLYKIHAISGNFSNENSSKSLHCDSRVSSPEYIDMFKCIGFHFNKHICCHSQLNRVLNCPRKTIDKEKLLVELFYLVHIQNYPQFSYNYVYKSFFSRCLFVIQWRHHLSYTAQANLFMYQWVNVSFKRFMKWLWLRLPRWRLCFVIVVTLRFCSIFLFPLCRWQKNDAL